MGFGVVFECTAVYVLFVRNCLKQGKSDRLALWCGYAALLHNFGAF